MQKAYDCMIVGSHPDAWILACWLSRLKASVLLVPSCESRSITPWGALCMPYSNTYYSALEMQDFIYPLFADRMDLKQQLSQQSVQHICQIITDKKVYLLNRENYSLLQNAEIFSALQYLCTENQFSIKAGARTLLQPCYNAFLGGEAFLYPYLVNLCGISGVDVFYGEIGQVFFTDKKVYAVQLLQHPLIKVSHLIWNATLTNIPFLNRYADCTQPSGWRFTLAVQMAASFWPTLLFTRAIFNTEEFFSPIELEIDLHEGSGQKSAFTLYMRCLLPWDVQTLSFSFQKKLILRMLSYLEKILPFSERYIQSIYPQYQQEGLSSALFLDQAHKGEYSFSHLEDIPNAWRIFSKSVSQKKDVENFFLVPQPALCEWGRWGESLSICKVLKELLKSLPHLQLNDSFLNNLLLKITQLSFEGH